MKIFPRSRGDLGAFSRRDENLGGQKRAEITARSRRDENLGGQKRAEITGEISAAKNALGGQKRAEITGEISVRREMKISAAKNAPRLLRDLGEISAAKIGGQKRAEISAR